VVDSLKDFVWGDYMEIMTNEEVMLQPRGPLCKICLAIALGFPLMSIEEPTVPMTK
jgi:hypothetical protein